MPTTALEPIIKLTEEQIRFFRSEGFLKLDAITDQEEVAWLRDLYDRLFADHWNRDVGSLDLAAPQEAGMKPSLPQITDPLKVAPELQHTRFRANALTIARQLFGPEVQYRNEHMIYKPARTAPETPWHQDQAYHDPSYMYRNVNFWLPLQEATPENGCMQFVPKSHTWDVLPHHHIGNDPRIHGLEADDAERFHRTSVACPIPAGGATLHHSYMLHYAGANRSDIPRRAYIMVFALPKTARSIPRIFPWRNEQPAKMG